MAEETKDGANLIVLDREERILVVKEKTRKQLWMLPGGGIERGELDDHAASSETEEETGIITEVEHLKYMGKFVQKPMGWVFLYETRRFKGEITVRPDSEEVAEARFMSFDEILEMGEVGFRTAYLRMILRWKRCDIGVDKTPYQGWLSDPVEFPKNFKGNREDYLKIMHRF